MSTLTAEPSPLPPQAPPLGTAPTEGQDPQSEGNGHRIGHARQLVGCIDAVIRAVRAASGSTPRLALRAVDLWLARPDLPLTIFPNRIECEGKVVLNADSAQSKWILPAFMSGLRQVSAEPTLNVDDMLRLADELTALDSSTDAVLAFQNWLWEDGAEGFVIELEPSFVEAINDVEGGGAELNGFLGVTRGLSVSGNQQNHTVISRDLDRAALREEFDIPVVWDDERSPSASALTKTERQSLANRLDNPAGWLRKEMEVSLRWARLQEGMPAPRMARRIQAVATQSADADLITFTRELFNRDGEYYEQLRASLDQLEIMSAFARGINTNDRNSWLAFAAWRQNADLDPHGEALTIGLQRLLRGEGQNPSPALASFLRALGPPSWLEQLQIRRLGEVAGRTLLSTLRGTESLETSNQLLVKLIDELSPLSATELLEGQVRELGSDAATHAGTVLARTDEPQTADKLLTLLLREGSGEAIGIVGRFLSRTGGRSWRPRTLSATLQRLSETKEGRHWLVDLFRNRGASDRTRLIALQYLQSHPAAKQAALKRRFTDLTESSQFREAVRHSRGSQ